MADEEVDVERMLLSLEGLAGGHTCGSLVPDEISVTWAGYHYSDPTGEADPVPAVVGLLFNSVEHLQYFIGCLVNEGIEHYGVEAMAPKVYEMFRGPSLN